MQTGLTPEPSINNGFRLGITAKLAVIISLIVISITFVIGYWIYSIVEQDLSEEALKTLTYDAVQAGRNFETRLEIISENLAFISGTPPVQGYIRSINNNNVDPIDGSTVEHWQKRLEKILTAYLNHSTEIIRIHYIGYSDESMSILVMEKKDGSITSSTKLETVYHPIYLATLKAEKNIKVISSINPAEDNIDESFNYVMSIAIPVYDSNNEIFGAIIFDIDTGVLLREINNKLLTSQHLFILDENNRIIYPAVDDTGITKVTENIKFNPENRDFSTSILSSEKGAIDLFNANADSIENYNIGFYKSHFDENSPDRYLSYVVASEVDIAELASKSSRSAIGFILILALPLSVLIIAFIARTLTVRLNKMNVIMSEYDDIENWPEYRLKSIDFGNDELGILYNTFLSMRKHIKNQTDRLSESETKNRTILNTLVDGVITINHEGKIISFNAAAEDLFLYSSTEVIGKNIKMLMPGAISSQHDRYLKTYLETQQPHIIGTTRELVALRSNGEEFPIELSVAEMRINNERFFSGVIRDISERKKSENLLMQREEALKNAVSDSAEMTIRLKESETRQRTILKTLVDGVITINYKGRVISYNPAAELLFQYKENEVIGKNIKMLMPEYHASMHDGYLSNYHKNYKKNIIGSTRELIARRKDGTEFPMELSVAEMDINGKTYYSGVIRDISERKHAEKELYEREQALTRSNQELEKFAYVASHDLQEPLRKIQSFGDRLITKYIDKLGEKGADYIHRMQNASSRMRTLIEDLLKFSRVSTHGDPFAIVDLNKIIKGVMSDLEIRIDETNAMIRLDHLPVIDADPSQMRQLFQNLLGNALKFTREGVTPEIHIIHESYDPESNGLCKITVQDNGIGFSSEYEDKIFEVFQRLHSRDEYTGTGIGLAIVKRIVERHGGSISASSNNNEGSRFVIYLKTHHPVQSDQDIELRQNVS